jgi:hypothetical protein
VRPFAVTAETGRFSRPMLDRLLPALDSAESARFTGHYPDAGTLISHPGLEYRLALFRGIAAVLQTSAVRAAFCAATLPQRRRITPFDCRGGFG